MKTWKTLAILVALMLAVFAGCSDMIESLSQIELKVTINDHNIPLDSVFTLYGTHEGSRDQVTKVLGSVTDSTLLPLQSGTWNLRVEARENGIVKGEGSCTVSVSPGTTMPATINMIYQYAVTFNADGGSSLSIPGKDVVYAAPYGSLATATKTGYTLEGWYTAQNGSGTKVDQDTIVTIVSPQILHANWVANTYAVTFDKQSGTNGSDTVSATYDATMPSATAPMRTGYTFGGYYDQANGAGTQYYTAGMGSSRSWDKTEATTLFAKWTAISYALTYVLEDGTNNSANPGSYMVETATITLQAPTKTGYTFDGWFSNSGFTGSQVTAIALGSTGDRTLYAKWTPISYTVTFDKQSGSDGSVSVNATYDAAMPNAIAPTRTGYTFDGYYDALSGGGTQYYTDTMESTRSWDKTDIAPTLYAKWSANTSVVTLDMQSGTGGSSSVSATYDAAMPNAIVPEKTGYLFGGYYDQINGGGAQYYTPAMASARTWDKTDETTTLYAKWSAWIYPVVLDMQSGTGGSGSVNATYDAAMPSAVAPTRTGYTFGGYYDQTNGGGTQYYTATMTSARSWDKADNAPVLYAKWTAYSYTVTFDKQSGTDGSDLVIATYDTTMPNATAPTKTGYTFGGYYDATDGNGTQYYTAAMTSARTWDKTEIASTLYAKWSANTTVVTLDMQSGTGGSSSVSVTYDAAMPNAIVPEKTGYLFGGYYDQINGGGAQYYTPAMASARTWNKTDETTTLYAKWSARIYPVVLDVQSGTGGSGSVSATYDAAMPSATVPTRTGYTFGGYYDQTNGGGTQYYTATMASARSWDKAIETTLYAKWTIDTYLVSYNANSASSGSAPSAQTKTYGINITLSSNTGFLAKTGYSFAGWNTATNGSGTGYAAGATYNTNAALALYAKWSANTTVVTLDMQLGTGGSSSVSATYDAAMPSAVAPTKTGYTFGGYYDATDGNGTQYYTAAMASARSWDKTEIASTLYAKWSANTTVVTLDMQLGTGGSGSVSATYDAAMPNAIVPEKTGYLFGGYYDQINGGGTQYYTPAMASARTWNKTDETTTLYAKWSARIYPVVLDVQSGTGGSGSVSATYDAAMPSATVPTRTGYTFGGYYDQTNGGGTQYYTAAMASARSWDKADNAPILYAKWTIDTYLVSYNANSASSGSAPSAQTKTYGTDLTLASNTGSLAKTGYSFAGWNTATNGSGTDYAAGATYSTNAALALYAKWSANTTVVTLDMQLGTGGSSSVSATYDAAMPNAIVPEKTGYLFGGYYDQINGGGTQYYTPAMASARSWDKTEIASTLYAKWSANTSVVTLDMQSGTGGSSSVSATYDAAMPNAIVPEKTGYLFGGYYDQINGGGAQYYTPAMASARTWDKTDETTTLYAKWSAWIYPVVLDMQSGTGGSGSVNATYDAAMPSAVAPTRTGYTFGGYYDQTNGGGTQYYTATMTSARSWDKADNAPILYAKWTIDTYLVSYNANSASSGSAPSAQTKTYGINITLASNTGSLAKAGYSFAGWNTAANGSGTGYAAGATYSTNAALALYAKWSANTTVVTLDKQSGTGGSSSVSATYDAAMPNAIVPEKTGYLFGGYYDQINGGGTQYYTPAMTSARTWDKTDETTTLYAKWSAWIYPVVLDMQLGTSGSSSVNATYDAAMPSAVAPTRTGYTFGGYYDQTNGGGTQYYTATMASARSWDKADNAPILYAKWTANSYTVTFASESGSTPSPASKSVTYGQAYGTLATTSRDGYLFDGWYTGTNGTGTKVDGTTTVSATTNHTLYAKWQALVVGGLGPAGGYIFHDNGNYSDGWRYLEAAPSDIMLDGSDYGHIFGYYRTTPGGSNQITGATSTAIGTGKANTATLVDMMGTTAYIVQDTTVTTTTADYAAKLAYDYSLSVGGVIYDDWFLPSKDELNLIYLNLKVRNLGNLSPSEYWSSSEGDASVSWYQWFGGGNHSYGYRSNTYIRVRPVRAF